MNSGAGFAAFGMGEDGGIHRILDRPSIRSYQPRPQNLFVDAGFARQFYQGEGVATILNCVVRDPIVSLLALRGPAAVARFVVAVVVLTIKRGVFGALAHIGKEVLKDQPSFAKGNAARLVVLESSGIGPGTARNHVAPRGVSWAHHATASVLMAAAQAAARLRMPASKSVHGHGCGFPALAFAVPPAMPARLLGWLKSDSGQPTKNLSSQIQCCRHIALLIRVVTYHNGAEQTTNGAP